MGLLKQPKKSKPLRAGGGGGGVSAARPAQQVKTPPCTHKCPSDNDIRGWLTVIAQREKSGLTLEQAYDKAWQIEMVTNPFPAIMGRVCPHPCEGGCNRKEKDDPVAINSVERSIGDWGIAHKLKAPTLEGGPYPEKIAVVGAGPAGLSAAYQLGRRGYKVTVFEKFAKSGGMLRYGIPEYRLPRDIIDAEVARLAELGVEFKYNCAIGEGITVEQLQKDYDAIFMGIGAHQGKKVGVPGEDGPDVYTGTDFLRGANEGKPPEVGQKVVVVGGGDTAIDAARVCLRCALDAAQVSKRGGAEVTILYRRTRTEMPAIEREIEEALEEDIKIEYLAAPAKIIRGADGRVIKMAVQRMELGEPDKSGRRRPVPIEGKIDEIEVNTVITAVSQKPETDILGAFNDVGWLNGDAWGKTGMDKVWTGGDNTNLGIATAAIGQGAKAARGIHAFLRGVEPREDDRPPVVGPERMRFEHYDTLERTKRNVMTGKQRLANPKEESDKGITAEQTLAEVQRCLSCGNCFGCEKCWMYCTPSCFKKIPETKPGAYYKVDLGTCDGCRKCAEECPCGFLDMI